MFRQDCYIHVLYQSLWFLFESKWFIALSVSFRSQTPNLFVAKTVEAFGGLASTTLLSPAAAQSEARFRVETEVAIESVGAWRHKWALSSSILPVELCLSMPYDLDSARNAPCDSQDLASLYKKKRLDHWHKEEVVYRASSSSGKECGESELSFLQIR